MTLQQFLEVWGRPPVASVVKYGSSRVYARKMTRWIDRKHVRRVLQLYPRDFVPIPDLRRTAVVQRIVEKYFLEGSLDAIYWQNVFDQGFMELLLRMDFRRVNEHLTGEAFPDLALVKTVLK